MAALGTWIAGPYTGTMDGQSIGILDPQGTGRAISFRGQHFQHRVQGHTYGLTPIDFVDQGAAYICGFICEESIKGALRAMWPLSATAVGFYTQSDVFALGVIGKIATDYARSLVLTAVAGTQAAARGPATLTALVYPTESTREMIYDTEVRKFQAEFHMILQSYSGTYAFAGLTF